MKFEEWFLKKYGSFEEASDLKSLAYRHNNITSLKGIENLINLEKLYCDNNNISSLKGIENLSNLETLYCDNNNISDLEYKKLLGLNPLIINGEKLRHTQLKYLINIHSLIR